MNPKKSKWSAPKILASFLISTFFFFTFSFTLNAQTVDITSGLISHWTFDEGGGTTANDSSGNNTLTFFNGPAWVTGKVGNGALSFDGVNDYVEKDAPIVSSYPFTFSVWVKASAPGTIISITDKDANTPYYSLTIGTNGEANMVMRPDTGTANTVIAGSGDLKNAWHHITGVFASDTQKKLYVDGSEVAESTASKTFNGAIDRVSVGRLGRSSHTGYIPGSIDGVRVYNRALSASEVLAIYNSENGGGGIPYTTPYPTPYVTPSVSNPVQLINSAGTLLNTYATIQSCLNATQPGNTCVVNPGTYTENLTFPQSGTSGNLIKLEAQYPFSKNSAANRTIINGSLTLKAYTKVYGMEFVNNGVSINGNGVEVVGNYIHGIGDQTAGIGINIIRTSNPNPFYSNILIKDNYIYQITYGMMIHCSDNCLIENNDIERLYTPIACRPAGACSGDSDHVRMFGNGITFRGNKIHGSQLNEIDEDAHIDGIQSFNNGGLGGQGRDTLTNTVIENNTIQDAHQMIWWTSTASGMLSHHVTIRNNIFNNTWLAAARMAIGGPNSDEIYVYNNVFNQTARISAQKRALIKNNIFFGNLLNTHDDKFLWPQGNFEISNNIFLPSGWMANIVKSHPQMAATNLFDLSPQNIFVNSNQNNFTLKEGSPAINAGQNLSGTGFSYDYNSTFRPQGLAWDIGAYEYTSGTPYPTPYASPYATPGDGGGGSSDPDIGGDEPGEEVPYLTPSGGGEGGGTSLTEETKQALIIQIMLKIISLLTQMIALIKAQAANVISAISNSFN